MISPETAIKIDQEIKRIIVSNYDRAKTLLVENKHLLEKIAEALLERETLDTEEIRLICEGVPLKELADAGDSGKKEPAKVKGAPVVVPQN